MGKNNKFSVLKQFRNLSKPRRGERGAREIIKTDGRKCLT